MLYGKVQSVKGDYAVVTIERQDMCGDCHACDMVHDKKTCTLTCVNTLKAQKGDEVKLELKESTFLKATYLLYGVPFLGLFGGLMGGYFLATLLKLMWGELLMVLVGIIGMAIGCLYIYWTEKKHKYQKMLPKIIEIKKE